MTRSIHICGNCVSNMQVVPTGCFTLSILDRSAILLIGGDKTGRDRWYEENVPWADSLYDTHLAELAKEGFDDGKKIR